MRAFMLFTNDLDATRGQSFRDTHRELLQLITDAGFTWTNETLHCRNIRPLSGHADGGTATGGEMAVAGMPSSMAPTRNLIKV
jgi:hypothetical protein